METTNDNRSRGTAAFLAACGLALLFFGIVEAVHPYFFLQDDNRDIFLPFYVHDYRAAADGQLALYNFYQSLGKPHFATGQVAALQPFVYVSIFLSKSIFGHVFAAIDILTLLYLLLGAAGTVALVRLLRFSDTAAVFVAVAWIAAPFNVLTSQSWATYSPVVGLLPWMLAATVMICRRRFAGGGALFVVSHLLLFYVGAPQFFVYAGMLEIGVVAWLGSAEILAHSVTRRDFVRIAVALAGLTLLIVLLSMPLLLPMWNTTQQSAFRGRSYPIPDICSIPVSQLLNGFALPFTQLFTPRGRSWCERLLPASFTHQGYIATILICIWPLLRRRFEAGQRRTCDAFFVAGVVLVIGALGGLTWLTSLLPLVNRFRWPFKFFGFANLPLLICAAPALDTLRSTRFRAAVPLAIALQFANLTAVDLTFPLPGFFQHLDPVPWREPLRNVLASSRTLTLGCRPAAGQSVRGYTAETLGFDYATLWELHYFGGYDPLVPLPNYVATGRLDYNAVLCIDPRNIPINYFRTWGVGHYILDAPLAASYEPPLIRAGMRPVAADSQRVVMADPFAPSLVSGPGCTMRSLGRKGDDFTTTVECRMTSVVTLRFLFNPNFVASVDGRETPADATAEGQVAIRVPAGRHAIRLDYEDPAFDAGLRIAAAALVAALVLLLLVHRSKRAD